MTATVITLSLTPAQLRRARVLAKRRNLSLNRLLEESIELLERQERDKKLFADFSRIGESVAQSNVEFSQAAQAEVLETS